MNYQYRSIIWAALSIVMILTWTLYGSKLLSTTGDSERPTL